MRVLIVNGNYDGGGAAKIALELYNGLKEAGVETYYIVGWDKEKRQDIEAICTSFPLQVMHALRRELHGGVCYTNFYARQKIIEFIHEKQIDIVHFHNIANNYFGLEDLQVIAKHCKVAWTLHEMWALTGHCGHAMECDSWIKNECKCCPDIKRAVAIRYDCAHKVWTRKRKAFTGKGITFVTPSEWLKRECLKSYLKQEEICVINNGIRPCLNLEAKRDKIRKKYGIKESENVILFVAGSIHSEYKGFKYLRKALIEMEDSGNYRLFIVGQGDVDGELRKKVSVETFGMLNDATVINELYTAVDLLILPSIAENFPTVAIESLYAGTPILGFATGGIPEIVGDECGWIVDKYDSTGLKRKLEYIFTDKQENLYIKRKTCRMRAEKLFSYYNMIKRHLELYENILTEGK